MREIKVFNLCADDFGLNPGVSQGILKLAQMKRLSAVSCMVNMPHFATYAGELHSLKDQIQIGLHFNLTEGNLLSFPEKPCFSLNELLIRSHLSSIKLSLVADEFNRQLERFVQVMGHMPDFIDGHQHVHQFPRIRQVILDLYEHQLRRYGTAIRSTYPSVNAKPYRFKAKILALTGGKALQAALIKSAIPHNSYFSGIYDFSLQTDYRALFRSWLDSMPHQTLVMCHPGEEGEPGDTIAGTRLRELDYFASTSFQDDCVEYGIQLLVK